MTACGRTSRREDAIGVAGEREGDGSSKRACVIIRCERRLSIRLRSRNKRSSTGGQMMWRKKRANEERKKRGRIRLARGRDTRNIARTEDEEKEEKEWPHRI